jgi:hypothetical protein
VIEAIRAQGITSAAGIAKALNERKIPTARGGNSFRSAVPKPAVNLSGVPWIHAALVKYRVFINSGVLGAVDKLKD